jgi:hypothetical protein
MLFADLARHVANAFEPIERRDPSETLKRIRAGIEVELDSQTDQPGGRVR